MTVVSVVAFALLGLVTSSAAAGDDPKAASAPRLDVVAAVVSRRRRPVRDSRPGGLGSSPTATPGEPARRGTRDHRCGRQRTEQHRVEPWAPSPRAASALLARTRDNSPMPTRVDQEGDAPAIAPTGALAGRVGSVEAERGDIQAARERIRHVCELNPRSDLFREVLQMSTLNRGLHPHWPSGPGGPDTWQDVLAARILGVQDRGYLALLSSLPAVLPRYGVTRTAARGDVGLTALHRSRWAEVVPTRSRARSRSSASPSCCCTPSSSAGSSAAIRAPSSIVGLAAVPIRSSPGHGTAPRLQSHDGSSHSTSSARCPPLQAGRARDIWSVELGAGGRRLDRCLRLFGSADALGRLSAARLAPRRALPPEALRSMLRFGLKGLLGWTWPVETFTRH